MNANERAQEHDVVIVGAGPGGAACALYLARHGIASAIVEKDRFPRFHIGESLTGEVGQRLRELGLGAYMEQSDHPIKHGVNVYGPRGNPTFRVPVMARLEDGSLQKGTTWQVPRDDFDSRMLEEAVRQGATLVQGKACGVIREQEGVRGVLVQKPDGARVAIHAKIVVDASGQTGFLHGQGVTSRKIRGKYDKQLAVFSQLKGAIRNEGPEQDNTLILYKERNHWAWFIPLCSERVSVGVVVPSDYYRTRDESLEEFFLREIHELNPELARRLESTQLVEEVRGSSNYSYEIDDYTGDGFLCVGDSHRFIDPVFSFGLHLALHEADFAAQAIAQHFRCGEPMSRETFRDYQRMCDLGLDNIQDLIDAFWNNPHAFSHAAHKKYREDIINLFAGRIYDETPSPGLMALRKINAAANEKLAT